MTGADVTEHVRDSRGVEAQLRGLHRLFVDPVTAITGVAAYVPRDMVTTYLNGQKRALTLLPFRGR